MAVNFLMNILNRAHLPVFHAADHGPAVVFGGSASRFPTGSQIAHILLVNVGLGAGGGLPAAQTLLRLLRGHVHVQHQVGAGQTEQVVLKIVQPRKETAALLAGELTALMYGVAGGIAVA